MTLLVKKALGKYIKPTTNYRNGKFNAAEAYRTRDYIERSEAQLRRSKTHLSRDIATRGKMCIEKMDGNSRIHEEKLSNLLSTINSNKMLLDQSVVDHTEKLLGSSPYPTSAVTDEGRLRAHQMKTVVESSQARLS